MIIVYIICGLLLFAISGFLMQVTRLSTYRRRIIRTLSDSSSSSTPYVLNKAQEKIIKHCFLNRESIADCIKQVKSQ
ncbi:hypothetical protein [Psychromonas aquatilis]|uniref:Uncharacterized protein n=1 Tax=Psychromonas aquatilis TaxID=2005072 RepID=A0ABU9GME3_9GAMM